MVESPRIIDNDVDEISVKMAGEELRGWSYADETEQRTKMLAAREYVEGWHDGGNSFALPADHGQQMAQIGYERGYYRAISEALTILSKRSDISAEVRLELFGVLGSMQPGDKDRQPRN